VIEMQPFVKLQNEAVTVVTPKTIPPRRKCFNIKISYTSPNLYIITS